MKDCGTCVPFDTCGGGGTPHVCGCTKLTCAQAGADCGVVADGCGGTLQCPECTAPQWCGGGSSTTPNKCGCQPKGQDGWRTGSLISDVLAPGSSRMWDMPEAARDVDGQSATISALVDGEISSYLVVKNFAFQLPAFSKIDGVTLEVTRSTSSGEIADASIRLVKAASITGQDRASASMWPGGSSTGTYGGPTDLWGLTLTPADVASPDFGVAVSVKYTSFAGNSWAYIDAIRLRIDFSVASCPLPDTSPPGARGGRPRDRRAGWAAHFEGRAANRGPLAHSGALPQSNRVRFCRCSGSCFLHASDQALYAALLSFCAQ
jgi:hypothetical protein